MHAPRAADEADARPTRGCTDTPARRAPTPRRAGRRGTTSRGGEARARSILYLHEGITLAWNTNNSHISYDIHSRHPSRLAPLATRPLATRPLATRGDAHDPPLPSSFRARRRLRPRGSPREIGFDPVRRGMSHARERGGAHAGAETGADVCRMNPRRLRAVSARLRATRASTRSSSDDDAPSESESHDPESRTPNVDDVPEDHRARSSRSSRRAPASNLHRLDRAHRRAKSESIGRSTRRSRRARTRRERRRLRRVSIARRRTRRSRPAGDARNDVRARFASRVVGVERARFACFPGRFASFPGRLASAGRRRGRRRGRPRFQPRGCRRVAVEPRRGGRVEILAREVMRVAVGRSGTRGRGRRRRVGDAGTTSRSRTCRGGDGRRGARADADVDARGWLVTRTGRRGPRARDGCGIGGRTRPARRRCGRRRATRRRWTAPPRVDEATRSTTNVPPRLAPRRATFRARRRRVHRRGEGVARASPRTRPCHPREC